MSVEEDSKREKENRGRHENVSEIEKTGRACYRSYIAGVSKDYRNCHEHKELATFCRYRRKLETGNVP